MFFELNSASQYIPQFCALKPFNPNAGGPKLRKWYGAPDRIPSEVPVKELDPEADQLATEILEEEVQQDAILVADGDSPMGEQIILQLILARQGHSHQPCASTDTDHATVTSNQLCIATQQDTSKRPVLGAQLHVMRG